MPVALAAVAGALAAWAGVIVTILMVLRDKRFDELKAEMQEMRADVRDLGEKRLSIKA